MLKLPKERLAVIPISDPDKIGHIFVPDIAKERTDQGIVKYVGPDCPDIYVGDYVIFNGYSGTALKLESQEGRQAERVIILHKDFIYATIHTEEDITIPGLYFKDPFGERWAATYEQTLELIAQAFYENSNQFTIKTRPPKHSEYKAGG